MTEHPGEQFPPAVDPDVEPGFDPQPDEESHPDYDSEPEPESHHAFAPRPGAWIKPAAPQQPTSSYGEQPVSNSSAEPSAGPDAEPAASPYADEAEAAGSEYGEERGHPLVEEIMGRLDGLRERPVAEHAEVYADLHERLQSALVEADAEDRG